jgi:hypothetical protein
MADTWGRFTARFRSQVPADRVSVALRMRASVSACRTAAANRANDSGSATRKAGMAPASTWRAARSFIPAAAAIRAASDSTNCTPGGGDGAPGCGRGSKMMMFAVVRARSASA